MSVSGPNSANSDITAISAVFQELAADQQKFAKMFRRLDKMVERDGQSISLGIHNGRGVRILLVNPSLVKEAAKAHNYDAALQQIVRQVPQSIIHTHSKGPDKTVQVFGNKEITQKLQKGSVVLTDKNKKKIDVEQNNVVTLKDSDLDTISRLASQALLPQPAATNKSAAAKPKPAVTAPAPQKPPVELPQAAPQHTPKATPATTPAQAAANALATPNKVTESTKAINAAEQSAYKKEDTESAETEAIEVQDKLRQQEQSSPVEDEGNVT